MDLRLPAEATSLTTVLATAFVVVYAIYIITSFLIDSPFSGLIWDTFVSCLPTALILDPESRRDLRSNTSRTQKHAAKSKALRNLLGLNNMAEGISNGILEKLPSVAAGCDAAAVGVNSVLSRALSVGSRGKKATAATVSSLVPSGLGNWDNSCYQNSILQALSSLSSLPPWLAATETLDAGNEDAQTTNGALQETLAKLCDPLNNGRHIWTPAKLKNMSSWQQQDAQEYYSKVMDELDKDALNAARSNAPKPSGLETLLQTGDSEAQTDILEPIEMPESGAHTNSTSAGLSNPIEGLVAQRVACTQCAFSDGYSMIPFNCLTVPLGFASSYTLEDCLDEYTKREPIEGVECRSCTLRQTAAKLQQILPSAPTTSPASLPSVSQPAQSSPGAESISQAAPHHSAAIFPPNLRSQIAQRLDAVQNALLDDDFSDKTLKETCQIPAKAFVNSTKTREAIIARAPRSLVVHVNRSVFDEFTGAQRKNHAAVHYPMTIDLRRWTLFDGDASPREADEDLNLTPPYHLKAVVTHAGRHENGHYVCYRRHQPKVPENVSSPSESSIEEPWFRLSDEDVSPVTLHDVLAQASGVFMLFYERATPPHPGPAPVPPPPLSIASSDLPSLIPPHTASSITPSETDDDTDLSVDDSDVDGGLPQPYPLFNKPPSAQQPPSRIPVLPSHRFPPPAAADPTHHNSPAAPRHEVLSM